MMNFLLLKLILKLNNINIKRIKILDLYAINFTLII